MAWDFETDPEYQEKLDWVDEFVRNEVEPLDLAFPDLQFTPLDDARRSRCIDPLKQQVRDQGLWATHLGPGARRPGLRPAQAGPAQRDPRPLPLGAGRSSAARRPTPATPRSSPTTAPPEQKERYLAAPAQRRDLLLLLDDRAPRRRRPDAVQDAAPISDGDEWVINGWKFFSSNARTAPLPHRDGGDQPRRRAPTRACRCSSCPSDTPGREHRAQRRARYGRADERGLATP